MARQSLEESETRFKAERRVFEQELMRQSIQFEEKISGLIDHTQLSGLLASSGELSAIQEEGEGTAEAARADSPTCHVEHDVLSPSLGLSSLSASGGSSQSSRAADQYRCFMKLSNERNQALREQFHQAQAGREDLQMQTEELEARIRRAQEELREKDGTIKVGGSRLRSGVGPRHGGW